MTAAVVNRAIEAGPSHDRPLSIAGYVAAWPAAADEIAERDRVAAAGMSPADVVSAAAAARDRLLAAVDAVTGDPVVVGRRGPLKLSDLMVTRVNETVVHSLDLSASVPDRNPIPLDRPAVGVACRMLAGVLAEIVPGHTVEVRVPPFVAVQCVEGPRHTRGTPPNVVEVDAVTWVELATGRLEWSAAVADGRARASGERSDISSLLPVLS
jgi:uncharacterized protein (TIGR03083 family)